MKSKVRVKANISEIVVSSDKEPGDFTITEWKDLLLKSLREQINDVKIRIFEYEVTKKVL